LHKGRRFVTPLDMTQFADAARQTTRALRDLFPRTPLQRNDFLSRKYGAEI
jgi:threonine dehydratase